MTKEEKKTDWVKAIAIILAALFFYLWLSAIDYYPFSSKSDDRIGDADKNNHKVIKKRILDKLEPSLKVKYLQALKDYQKIKRPLKIKILLHFKDLLIQNDKMYDLLFSSQIAWRIHYMIRSYWKK